MGKGVCGRCSGVWGGCGCACEWWLEVDGEIGGGEVGEKRGWMIWHRRFGRRK